jgi:hypothetical protein
MPVPDFPWKLLPWFFFMWGNFYFGSLFLCVSHRLRLKLFPWPAVEDSVLPVPANSPEDTRPTADNPHRSQQKAPIPH